MALENELVDKEEKLRAAVSTRQEFAGQLVAAQQRELAFIAKNTELTEAQVNFNIISSQLYLNLVTKLKLKYFFLKKNRLFIQSFSILI